MTDIGQEARAELERLRAWKAEALEVLTGWERVWEAAGRPGRPGSSKAESVRGFIEASRPAPTAPWDEGGCFGHCDPEGWARCRRPASPATREAVARIISDAENQTDAEGSWALPEDVADALLAAFTITEKGAE